MRDPFEGRESLIVRGSNRETSKTKQILLTALISGGTVLGLGVLYDNAQPSQAEMLYRDMVHTCQVSYQKTGLESTYFGCMDLSIGLAMREYSEEVVDEVVDMNVGESFKPVMSRGESRNVLERLFS